MASQKRSAIWEYFDINSENNKFAICLLCKQKISRGGEGKKAGTSAMSNHLKLKHPEKFKCLKDRENTKSGDDSAIPSTSSSVKKKQQTLQESFQQKLVWNVTDPKAEKYNYLIGEMIALDNEPLSIVERVGFTRLLQHALPRYQLPSRTYMTQKIVPSIYDRIFEKLKISISVANAISITSDIWTCIHNNTSFLSFTAHWITFDFQLKHGVLAMKPFSGAHTGENIANELNAIMTRWDIEQSKIHIIVHDSGANMIKGVKLAEINSARCFIHSLQRVVNESIKIQPEVVEMIAKGRRLVSHFNHSSLAQSKLKNIQKELGLPEHILVQDVSTRWNSTFYMLERLMEQKRAIALYTAEHDTLNNLTTNQWVLMEQCINVLKPFEEVTKVTSSGLSCISEVVPNVAALQKFIEKDEVIQRTPELSPIRARLKTELRSRFRSLNDDINYIIATFLDPRFKASYLTTLQTEKARQNITFEHIKMISDESNSSSSSSSQVNPKKNKLNQSDQDPNRKSHDTFWDCFKEVANDNSSQLVQEKQPIASEIDNYLKSIRIDRSENPYTWWSANSQQFRHLAPFVKKYLSAPCSSVYSERLFSEAGLVYESKRNRLSSTNAEKLVFIHHNLPLVDFNY